MAFRFNFTEDDLELEEQDRQVDQPLDSSFGDLSLEEQVPKVPSQEYDVKASALPSVVQADVLRIPNVERPLYKRTLADVKFQMAEQDTLTGESEEESQVASMLNLNSNSDLIRGVYEGGFKTWECSIDLVQYLAKLEDKELCNKRVLELGCGSSLPALFLLQQSKDNHVDVQDYNEQVIKYITIPNILLNTLLTVQDATQPPELSEENDQESSSDEERGAEHGDYHEEEEDEEKDRIIGESATCDAEAELPEEQVPEMLRQLALRTRAFVGDWSGLPEVIGDQKYDMIVTSETIYAQEALPALLRVFQKCLAKPNGVIYVAAKTVYFGVGGGTLPFCSLVKSTKDENGDGFEIEKVFESDSTVKREILKLTWNL